MEMENSFSQQNTFKESKKEIINIFSKLLYYVKDSDVFLRSIHNSGAVFQALINADDEKSLSKHVEKVKGIQSVISRDNMKCAFFGRTSNGKSTTINAMLGDRILPAGIGHTTCCFLEIRGTKDCQGSASIISSLKPGSDSAPVELVDHKQIDSVLELARDVCSDKLSTDSLIRIAWPSQKCALLSEDVVILDSPGIDADSDIDKCIDMYCLDADVFVLVVNSTSTITKTEKGILHKVCDRLSKPNVFILNNYWDKSSKDPNHVRVRKQHMERCVNFLTNEIKVCSETEAENRVFFVSAKEVLIERSKKNECESGVPTSLDSSCSKPLREGWQTRQSEFTKFEEILGKTLSESATKTKFAAHSSQGQDIVGEVRCIVEALNEKTQEQKNVVVSRMNEMQTRCNTLTSKFSAARYESTADISQLSSKVSKMVADMLHNEVQHLDNIIDDFNHKFSDEPGQLAQYKIDLSKHVERKLCKSIKFFWDFDTRYQVEAVSTAILERYLALVPDKNVAKAMRQSEDNDYVPEFDIDYRSISSDFRETLTYQSSSNSMNETDDQSLVVPLVLVPHPIGLLIGVSAFIVGLFIRKRKQSHNYSTRSMDARSMEEALKTQFASYMTEKLEPQIEQTSKQIAEKPQYALNTTLKRLDTLVEKYVQGLRVDIGQLKSDIQRLEGIITKSQNVKNMALALENDFKIFNDKYILV